MRKKGVIDLKNQKRKAIKTLLIAFTLLTILFILTTPIAAENHTQLATETQNPANTAIHHSLHDTDQRQKIFVELKQVNPARLAPHTRDQSITILKQHAENTQRHIKTYTDQKPSVDYINSYWLTNAVTLEANTSQTTLTQIASIKGVEKIQPTHELQVTNHQNTTYQATWGVHRINSTKTWNQHHTQGDGVKIAVIDTGVDIDHPDIELYTDDESDPTYPGGWAEFDSNGDQVQGSTPHDTSDHGTHVSGTATGDNASGEYIGVAPDASLMHALALPEGSGGLDQIIAAMEWAVENDADVMSMSFGGGCNAYIESFIDPIQNARELNVTPVAAIGNDGDGCTSSPGNIYSAVAAGAINTNNNAASFSGGDEIDTDNAWDSPPAEWPDTYIKPDVTAPGVGVKSSDAGGGYEEKQGTSMAAPHLAGAVALLQSATEEHLGPDEIEGYLFNSSWHPDSGDKDTRYGEGIVDAEAMLGDAVGGFTVEINRTNSAITENESLEVEAVLTNTGASSTENITLSVGDTVRDYVEVELDLDEQSTVNLTWNTTVGDADNYNATVSGMYNSDSTEVSIEMKPIVGEESPRDLNNDSLYRDLDGDEELTANDVQVFFDEYRSNEVVQSHNTKFNFNEDTEDLLTIGDVQMLHGDIFP